VCFLTEKYAKLKYKIIKEFFSQKSEMIKNVYDELGIIDFNKLAKQKQRVEPISLGCNNFDSYLKYSSPFQTSIHCFQRRIKARIHH